MEAAALCKMADRGQITGAILDGPLALDNAISLEAATIKHLTSPVAGRANVILVPDLEAGNMLAKSLTFLANADAAGIVLGARVPVILTSRADFRPGAFGFLCRCVAHRAEPPGRRRQSGGLSHDQKHAIVVVNAGSSSIKFSLFDTDANRPSAPFLKGQIEELTPRAALLGPRGRRQRRKEPCESRTYHRTKPERNGIMNS